MNGRCEGQVRRVAVGEDRRSVKDLSGGIRDRGDVCRVCAQWRSLLSWSLGQSQHDFGKRLGLPKGQSSATGRVAYRVGTRYPN